jgi:hypothetical protein
MNPPSRVYPSYGRTVYVYHVYHKCGLRCDILFSRYLTSSFYFVFISGLSWVMKNALEKTSKFLFDNIY